MARCEEAVEGQGAFLDGPVGREGVGEDEVCVQLQTLAEGCAVRRALLGVVEEGEDELADCPEVLEEGVGGFVAG